MLSVTKAEIAVMMSKFMWSYKVGDNIAYNFKVLFTLYEDKDRSSDKSIYNKPLIVFMVSIIECVLYDFIVRLEQATNQYPLTIPLSKRQEIKKRLGSEKVKKDVQYLDETMTLQVVRNYSLDQLLKLMQDFELIGPKEHAIYTRFQTAARLRNRIHIFNWYNNFESKEKTTYSDARLEEIEKLLVGILKYMSMYYSRPDSQAGTDYWLNDMTP